MHKKTELFNVGIILKTRGLKGEVKVKSLTDFPERFQKKSKLFLQLDSNELNLEIAHSREQSGFWFLFFKDYDDINKVEALVGHHLYIKERNDQLASNEFYVSDLLNLPVYTINQEKVGVLTNILHYGPNDVWVITKNHGKEILLPYTLDFIKQVDLKNQKVIVDMELYNDEN